MGLVFSLATNTLLICGALLQLMTELIKFIYGNNIWYNINDIALS